MEMVQRERYSGLEINLLCICREECTIRKIGDGLIVGFTVCERGLVKVRYIGLAKMGDGERKCGC